MEGLAKQVEEVGLSVPFVAGLLGVSAATVRRWCRGQAVPNAANKAKLDEFLELWRVEESDSDEPTTRVEIVEMGCEESWLAADSERFGWAMMLCENPSGECAYNGRCAYRSCFSRRHAELRDEEERLRRLVERLPRGSDEQWEVVCELRRVERVIARLPEEAAR